MNYKTGMREQTRETTLMISGALRGDLSIRTAITKAEKISPLTMMEVFGHAMFASLIEDNDFLEQFYKEMTKKYGELSSLGSNTFSSLPTRMSQLYDKAANHVESAYHGTNEHLFLVASLQGEESANIAAKLIENSAASPRQILEFYGYAAMNILSDIVKEPAVTQN